MRTFLNMGLVKASTEVTRQPAAPLIAQAPAPEKRTAQAPKPERVARPAAKVASAPPAANAPPPAEPAPALRSGAPPIEIARVRPVIVGSRPANSAADEGPRTQPAPDRREGVAAASPWTASSTLAAPAQPPRSVRDNRRHARRFALHARRPGRQPRPRRGPACRAGPGSRARLRHPGGGSRPRPPPAAPQPAASRSRSAPSRARPRPSASSPPCASAPASVLARSSPVTLQVQQGQKVFYRARYAGFDAPAAAQACTELKRLKVDCLVMKAE